jgi:magnesium transporter
MISVFTWDPARNAGAWLDAASPRGQAEALIHSDLVRFTELIDSSREMASDLMQTHLAAASNKLNEIMKVLAMISTIVLPMTLIAGIYGMNFEGIPELHWELGYPVASGSMLLTGVGSLLFFRWRRWI